ncbi:MAG: Panacea domain-containing protein [Lachnospiraceae bacterium]|nr:Panacea domain-containing protein [Lachnospiraceae bacterium]
MRDVYDFAKFFIKNGADSRPNTYDGNMKLQKLLVLADLANIAENGEPLFNDQVLAFKNGCVVEKVRLRYKNDYVAFKRDSESYQPDFSESEYEILKLVMGIFGCASAKELSDINHTFNFWKTAFYNGTDSTGYHNKEMSVVDMISQHADVEKMREIISAYRETANNTTASETINGVTFYFDGFALTDDIIDQLESFSLSADDDTYSVYLDNGRLVIY